MKSSISVSWLSSSFLCCFLFLSWKVVYAATVVKSAFSCYTVNQSFVISFNTTTPLVGDVMGIVRNGTSTIVATSPTCLVAPCPGVGTVTIPQTLSILGFYKASLFRANKVTVLGSSLLFRLQTSSCVTAAPSKRPTKLPTRKPTKQPTVKPTRKPTLLPTRLPTVAPTTFTINEAAHLALTQARDVIAGMVKNNSRLTPQLLRMGFHDCIHVCDGCIDLTNPANFGLEAPIAALEPVVAKFANASMGVSRADIWALAVTVGADVADHGTLSKPVSFAMNWFGRVNCEDAQQQQQQQRQVCRNGAGQVVPCLATMGPDRNMAAPTLNSETVFTYFAKEFGFNPRQVVTIMGAHSVGHLVKEESGIVGPHGWTFDNVVLQNEYYNALMGAATAASPPSDIMAFSPRWRRAFQNNSGTVFDDVHTWSLTVGGKPLVMLDSDISLVRHLNSANQNSTSGAVSCAFNDATANGSPVCPLASTLNIVAQFSDSNDLWMNEFRDTLDLMLTNGYVRTPCSRQACPLTLVPGINDPPPTPPPTSQPPTSAPISPTRAPSVRPTSSQPSRTPTLAPTTFPTGGPTLIAPIAPTAAPAQQPIVPTAAPVQANTSSPTSTPVTPTVKTTISPTNTPVAPTAAPIQATISPTNTPAAPTAAPAKATISPTNTPVAPTVAPLQATTAPTSAPAKTTISPTTTPAAPTVAPVQATISPTNKAVSPTAAPVQATTISPTTIPAAPTAAPVQATISPTNKPVVPTTAPVQTTISPTFTPVAPSAAPV